MKHFSAKEVIHKLGLSPLPFEGGYFRQTFKNQDPGIPAKAFGIDAKSDRKSSSAIYYLITPESFSALHRVKSDEMFHFYCGDPVEMVQIGTAGALSRVTMGSDIFQNQCPQVMVSRYTWQALRLVTGGDWALLGTTVSPGYEDEDFELGKRTDLVATYPLFKDIIKEFTR